MKLIERTHELPNAIEDRCIAYLARHTKKKIDWSSLSKNSLPPYTAL